MSLRDTYDLQLQIDALREKIRCLSCCEDDFGITDLEPPVDAPAGDDPVVLFNPTTGIYYYWDGDSWEEFGSSGIVELTYAEADALRTAETVVPGTIYKITDRGDRGIFLTGLDTNSYSIEGSRIMLVPDERTYNSENFNDKNYLGVWHSGLSIGFIDDRVIWGGLVWRNLNGNLGAAIDDVTLDSEWEVIPKDSFLFEEYVEKEFFILFDFDNDWINKQWDGKGNVFGTDYQTGQSLGYNCVDISDWNSPFIFQNECLGVYNNTSTVYSNTIRYSIYRNSFMGDVSFNVNIGDIFNNSGPEGGITGNSNTGFISNNILNGCTILNNSNSGDINSNSVSGYIEQNTNIGSIQSNVVNGSISKNSNHGHIASNTCISITRNFNSGDIESNSNSGVIDSNANLSDLGSSGGYISNNSNNGNISFNINTGPIYLNSCLSIYGNSNKGGIYDNSISQNIYNNSNTGVISSNLSNVTQIYNNSNTGEITFNEQVGVIRDNMNNGAITGNTGTAHIYLNVNNGAIGPAVRVGNITDVVVNK